MQNMNGAEGSGAGFSVRVRLWTQLVHGEA